MIGIIGGSGLYESLTCISNKEKKIMHTPYGVAVYYTGCIEGNKVIYISRHGDAEYPPHKVPYKENIWALKELGVKRIIATSAVGTLNKKIKPGSIALPEQLIDLTKETRSFFEGRKEGIMHVDMTEPYCKSMRSAIFEICNRIGIKVFCEGTYVCLSGPAFETSAEIRLFKSL
ncbi:MAG: MTAP family purine nucleoside phosphorylase, partial [Candidatus Thermoplasmatota archaeon]